MQHRPKVKIFLGVAAEAGSPNKISDAAGASDQAGIGDNPELTCAAVNLGFEMSPILAMLRPSNERKACLLGGSQDCSTEE
jgi:hypothetical protein